MRSYEFLGKPIAWKRAGRNGSRYFDKQVEEKENMQRIVQLINKAVCSPSSPLSVHYQFNMPIPKSWSKERRLKAIGKNHTSVPDLDNLIKFVNDALNGILWGDDSQICGIYAEKVYAFEGSTKIIVFEEEND